MSRILRAATMAVVMLIGITTAEACGDKLLALGRGVRFTSAYKVAHPASIVVLDRDPSGKGHAEARDAMTKVGHRRFDAVHTPEELSTALQARAYDVVILDVADAVAVEELTQGAASKPSLLVLVTKPSKVQMQAAGKRYRWALKAPATLGEIMVAIDNAMDYRGKHPVSTAALAQ